MPVFTEQWIGTNGDPWNATRWPTVQVRGTGSVADIQSNQGRLFASNGGGARAVASTDTDLVDMDILLSFTLQGWTAAPGLHFLTHFRANGAFGTVIPGGWQVPDVGYAVQLRRGFSDDNVFSLIRRNGSADGDFGVTLFNVDPPPALNSTSKWWMRIQAEGVNLRARVWEDGQSEPGAWDIDHQDSQIASGRVQVVANITAGSGSFTTLVDTLEVYDLAAPPPQGILSRIVPAGMRRLLDEGMAATVDVVLTADDPSEVETLADVVEPAHASYARAQVTLSAEAGDPDFLDATDAVFTGLDPSVIPTHVVYAVRGATDADSPAFLVVDLAAYLSEAERTPDAGGLTIEAGTAGLVQLPITNVEAA
jgi:hypothetical protein